LEDKFDSLELNHVVRQFNKASNKLTKLAFGQELVRTSVFSSNLHKPSVNYEGSGGEYDTSLAPASLVESALAPPDPEVMEVDEDPTLEIDVQPDWKIPILECLVRGVLPLTRVRPNALLNEPKPFSC
jgi:hypothetical protein